MNKGLKVDLTGQRFGSRVVLGINSRTPRGHVLWNVKCDCGRKFTSLSQTLRKFNNCKNCSTKLKAPRLNRRKRPFEYRYNTCVNRARHPMLLSYDEFFAFTNIKECHYCGAYIDWGAPFGKNRPCGLNLDRKDSNVPYTIDNVVVSCRRCNYGKNNFFSYEEWKQLGSVIKSWRENAVS